MSKRIDEEVPSIAYAVRIILMLALLAVVTYYYQTN